MLRPEDPEFKDNLGYIVSSKTVWALYHDPALKDKNQQDNRYHKKMISLAGYCSETPSWGRVPQMRAERRKQEGNASGFTQLHRKDKRRQNIVYFASKLLEG